MDRIESIAFIEIKGTQYEMKPSFRVLSRIEQGLGMGLFAYVQKKTPRNDEEAYKGLDISLEEQFLILNEATGRAIKQGDLEEYIFENRFESLQKSIEFLSIAFGDKDDSENQESQDLKKKD